METERIDLGDGQWWEVRTRLTRAMEKAVTKASLSAMPAIKLEGTPDSEQIRNQLLSQMGVVDTGAVEDAYLLAGTIAYSFDPIVTLEIIDGLDAALVRQVLERMFQLYSPQRVTEVQRDGFFVTPSNRS